MTTAGAELADPFDTARLRGQVLAGWQASPARFREDANAEDELVRDAYRDRLVAELAQNAVDAAAPEPTKFLLDLTDERLLVANTGRPLDAAGVAGLSSLRASGKRDSALAVGRFGVGFAAVLAVGTRLTVGSGGMPAIRFDPALATSLVEQHGAEHPALVAELRRRGGHVPVLRLPFPAAPVELPAGYDTAVVIELDSPAAVGFARQLLTGLDPLLPLALPGLAELTVRDHGHERILRCLWQNDGALLDGVSWLLAERDSSLPAELWSDRPAEERASAAAAGHRVRLRALVRADGGALPAASPAVLRAPQPTDDPLSLPVMLSLPLPLDSSRRRSLPGPLRDALLVASGGLLAELASRMADPLPLVPVGLAAGEADELVRRSALEAMRLAPMLPGGVRPADAVALEGDGLGPAAHRVLGEVIAGLLPALWWGASRASALRALQVRRLDTGALVELLAGSARPPAFWAEVYEVLRDVRDSSALGAIPVPLADGRVVTGARGALMLAEGLAELAELAASVGALVGTTLRLVDPAASHPLLLTLGARQADAQELLIELRAAVEESVAAAADWGPETCAQLAEVVTALVASAGASSGMVATGGLIAADEEWGWLADLALPATDGAYWPAGALVHPRAPLLALLDPSVLAGPDALLGVLADPLAGSRTSDEWAAVGVLDSLSVQRTSGVVLGGELTGLADEDDYHQALLASAPRTPVLDELIGIRDLDLLADWPAVLRLLASDPLLREAVLTPARLGSQQRPSYTCWWLANHPVLGGQLPAEWMLPDADPLLAGLYDPVPAGLDLTVLRALGCQGELADLLADPERVADLLDRLGDPDRPVSRAQTRLLYAAAADALGELAEPPAPPLTVRALDPAGELVVVPAAEAVLVDSPDLLGVLARPVVMVPASSAARLSRLLGVPLASTLVAGQTTGGAGTVLAVPELAGWLLTDLGASDLAARDLGPRDLGPRDIGPCDLGPSAAALPTSWRQVADLAVAGHPVRWRLENGEISARDLGGLARGLAWRGGCWSRRFALAEWLAGDQDPLLLAAEDELDEVADRADSRAERRAQ